MLKLSVLIPALILISSCSVDTRVESGGGDGGDADNTNKPIEKPAPPVEEDEPAQLPV